MATGVYLSSHKKKRTALLLCIFYRNVRRSLFLCGKMYERSACNVHLQLPVYRMAA